MSQIIIANDLRTGEIVYFAQDRSWTADLAKAQRFASADEAKAVLESKEMAGSGTKVIGAEAIALTGAAGGDRPESLRDRIRAIGPTVRTDLNRALKNA